jgi:hypothetical protein
MRVGKPCKGLRGNRADEDFEGFHGGYLSFFLPVKTHDEFRPMTDFFKTFD